MASRKPSLRSEQRELGERMRGLGMTHREIAAEMSRRYRLRPRTALRTAWGWTLDEAAARYNAHSAADPQGRASMRGTRLGEYETWPFGGRKPSLTALGVLAEVYQVAVLDLVDVHDREKFTSKELLLLSKTGTPIRHPGGGQPGQDRATVEPPPGPHSGPAGSPVPHLTASLIQIPNNPVARATPPIMTPYSEQNFAYRRIQGTEPEPIGTAILHEVMMAAHEGSDHAERAERRDIGEATLEQIRADVVRLSREYMTEAPWPLFQEMRLVRARIHAALDRQMWPRDQTELYFLLAVLNTLMSVAAKNLGSLQAADELARSGWAFALMIDNRPLMARVRTQMSHIAYWSDSRRRSRDYAASGLEYLSTGPNGAEVYLMYARAAARLGEADEVRRAIAAAEDAREQPGRDDELLEIGGEFGYSRATQHYQAGSALIELPQAEEDALAELERAAQMYADGPEEGEDHSKKAELTSRIDLAIARLRAGQLDGAASAVAPVLALAPRERIDPLPQRFGRVRAELASPRYRGSGAAQDLDERIEVFCEETIAGDLRELGAPASS